MKQDDDILKIDNSGIVCWYVYAYDYLYFYIFTKSSKIKKKKKKASLMLPLAQTKLIKKDRKKIFW